MRRALVRWHLLKIPPFLNLFYALYLVGMGLFLPGILPVFFAGLLGSMLLSGPTQMKSELPFLLTLPVSRRECLDAKLAVGGLAGGLLWSIYLALIFLVKPGADRFQVWALSLLVFCLACVASALLEVSPQMPRGVIRLLAGGLTGLLIVRTMGQATLLTPVYFSAGVLLLAAALVALTKLCYDRWESTQPGLDLSPALKGSPAGSGRLAPVRGEHPLWTLCKLHLSGLPKNRQLLAALGSILVYFLFMKVMGQGMMGWMLYFFVWQSTSQIFQHSPGKAGQPAETFQGRAEINFLLSRPIGRRRLLAWRLFISGLTWIAILGSLAVLDRCLMWAASLNFWQQSRGAGFAADVAASGIMGGSQMGILLVVALFGLLAGQIRLTFEDLPWWKQLLKPSFYLVVYPLLGAILLMPLVFGLGTALPGVRLVAMQLLESQAGVLYGLLALWFLFNLWYCDREWKYWDVRS